MVTRGTVFLCFSAWLLTTCGSLSNDSLREGDGRVAGRLFHMGWPVEGARLSVVGLAGEEAVSAEDGSFAFEALPAGPRSLLAIRLPDVGLRIDTLVARGHETEVGDVSLLALGRVVGTAFTAGAQEADGARIWLQGTAFEGIADEGGAFEVEGVPQGCYELAAELGGTAGAVARVCVPAGKTAFVEVTLGQ